jgi:hypothetical protein
VERGGMARLGDTVDLAPDGALATPGESRDRTAA